MNSEKKEKNIGKSARIAAEILKLSILLFLFSYYGNRNVRNIFAIVFVESGMRIFQTVRVRFWVGRTTALSETAVNVSLRRSRIHDLEHWSIGALDNRTNMKGGGILRFTGQYILYVRTFTYMY